MDGKKDVTDESGRRRVSSWLHETPDGRVWQIDDFGPGKVRATWLMSPTGYSEWVEWVEWADLGRTNLHKPQPGP
jgi:hypothetical protein